MIPVWATWQPGERPIVHIANEIGQTDAPVSLGQARLMIAELQAYVAWELDRLLKERRP